MSRSVTIMCDRCGSIVTDGGSVVEVEVTAGELRQSLPGRCDLCHECGRAFLHFLRVGHQMHQEASPASRGQRRRAVEVGGSARNG
jgi:hypothetical protein